MTTAPTRPDLSSIKARQQLTWSSGNFSVVAARIVLVSEQLVDAADLRAGSHVIDVACGNGNAALAAARSGAHVLGVDYAPALLEDGKARAATEGLDVEFALGDAENLPVPSQSFDALLSVFGTMFAPDHQRTADEVLRVTRPGATVGLASWTPDGFIGQMFRVIGGHVVPPAGAQSPLLWGTEEHLRDLFGDGISELRAERREWVQRFPSPEFGLEYMQKWFGPTKMAFMRLDRRGREALASDLLDLSRRHNMAGDAAVVAPAAYLEVVATRAG